MAPLQTAIRLNFIDNMAAKKNVYFYKSSYITLSPISDTNIEPIDYVRIFRCFSPDSLQYAT